MTEAVPGPGGARVLYLLYANPSAYPPIVHGAALLADEGCVVEMIGLDTLSALMPIDPQLRARVRLLPAAKPGWRQRLHYVSFVATAVRMSRRIRPTWVYASDALSAPIALMVRAVTGARVVYHEHDAPTTTASSARHLTMRGVLRCRGVLARAADVCIVPNEGRAALLAATTGRSGPNIVRNTPLRREVPPEPRVAHPERMCVLYGGSIAVSRPSTGLLQAIAQLPTTVTLRIVGYDVTGGTALRQLREQSAALGLDGRVDIRGPVPRHELLSHSHGCDVGFAVFPDDPTDQNGMTMLGASNKVYDYLAAGLPVLVADHPDWRAAFVEPGYGRACRLEEVSTIVEALRWFLDHPDERRAMGLRGRARILDEWNYDREFAPVLARMVAAPRHAGGANDRQGADTCSR